MWWLMGTYFLQTLGELLLSPIGLSAMSKLAPDRAAGFMMGIWFLSTSIGNWLAGKAVSLTASMPMLTVFEAVAAFTRSEEHTSELQSLRHLVCRLLLE